MNWTPILNALLKVLEEHPELIFNLIQGILDMVKANPEMGKDLASALSAMVKK